MPPSLTLSPIGNGTFNRQICKMVIFNQYVNQLSPNGGNGKGGERKMGGYLLARVQTRAMPVIKQNVILYT
ncbi:MAG: hypothetical protein JW717_10430 [Marinilabiliaceae bacterium]|nr:hypothetical protein [Marinilabiliaceae bacterium]